MNSLIDLHKTVNVINYASIPALKEVLFNLNLHVGEYKWSARNIDFAGWLVCDGRSLSRADYVALFEVIGTSFGADNSNTFKLPDYRGRVMGCYGQGSNLTNRTIGANIGSETHTLTINEIPGHTHGGTTAGAGNHTHTASASTEGSHNHSGVTSSAGNHSHSVNDPGHTHTQTTINDDYNNSGANPPGFSADSTGSATWNNINNSTTGISINSNGAHTHVISSDGSHNHTITVTGVPDHNHTFTTLSTGGGQAHNNMQPTLFGGCVLIFSGFKPPMPIV